VEAEEQLALKTDALERANRRLHELVVRDELTGLFNRRYLNRRLDPLWRRARREGGELQALMIDIDHFKRYNDTYGHAAGDACLRRVSSAIGQTFRRAAEVVARYGGEEFVVIAPRKPDEDPMGHAERLLRAVRQLDLAHKTSPSADRVTVSVGAATSRDGCMEQPADLIRHADQALYQAKLAGRDRAVRWSPAVAAERREP
jgi:diguanylate cyclase (GGDEF)-like protein